MKNNDFEISPINVEPTKPVVEQQEQLIKKNWFDLTPRDKIELRYITWTDNHKYQWGVVDFNIGTRVNQFRFRWKIHLQIIPFFRWLFDKPINYDKLIKELDELCTDVSQMDVSGWFKYKKNKFRL